MLAVDFSIHHYGCPASESTEKFPDVSLRVLGTQPREGSKAWALIHAVASRDADLRRFLAHFQSHRAVTSLGLVDRAEGNAVFRVALKSNVPWVTRAILDNNGFYSTSIPVAEGTESWHVLVDERGKTALCSRLDKLGALHIDRIHKFEFGRDGRIIVPSWLSGLSPRQLRVLREAVNSGYFDYPRKIDSRELAKKNGIAQSTLLEHLRKAQAKILRQVLTQ